MASSEERDDLDDTKPEWWFPTPRQIGVSIGGRTQELTYEQAFSLGCSLLEKGDVTYAAKLFERLEEFPDRGPRAFIMQAFCEAAARHFDKCSQSLAEAFQGEERVIAAALHDAFLSYHVGVRQDAMKAMSELVNTYREYPTLCLLLGNMLEAAGNEAMARKCWSLAVHRDRPGGAVSGVAMRQLKKVPVDSPTKLKDS